MMDELSALERARHPELDARVALLLGRRRAGVLSDDKLHLAAYLGDPAARAVNAPRIPDEDALRRELHPRFFAGVAEEVENRWRHLVAESRAGSGRLERVMARLIEAAAREPRLRRLVPVATHGLAFQRSTEEPCFFQLSIRMHPRRSDPTYNLAIGCYRSRGEEVLRSDDVEDIVAAAVSALPEIDLEVTRGPAMGYPTERARRDAYNDERDLEAWLCGLSALGYDHLLRGLLTLLLQELREESEDGSPEATALRTLARIVLDPSAIPNKEVLAQTNRLQPFWLARVLPTLWGKRAPGYARRSLLLALGQEESVQTRLRRALIPWALGDADPLARLAEGGDD